MASLPLQSWPQGASPRPATESAASIVGVEAAARLSALEWSIVAMAERDRFSSLREPGRIVAALGSLFGVRRPNRLANDRLEALRRIAVLAWHHGYTLPVSEIKAFMKAGFSADQFETLLVGHRTRIEADKVRLVELQFSSKSRLSFAREDPSRVDPVAHLVSLGAVDSLANQPIQHLR